MTDERFWKLIEVPHDNLRERVAALEPLEVAWLYYWMRYFNGAAKTRMLYDFFLMAFDECFGGESFLNARYWLVFQGREIYLAAIKGPDSLVPVMRDLSDGEITGEGGPWDIITERFLELEDTREFSDLPSNEPPIEFVWPTEFSGEEVIETERPSHFPNGYNEFVLKGKKKR